MPSYRIETPVGTLLAVWSDRGLLQSCGFMRDSDADNASPVRPTENFEQGAVEAADDPAPWGQVAERQRLLEDALDEYFRDGLMRWDLDDLDWSAVAPFHRTVLKNCYQIPSGETISYAGLATRSGSPRAARAVGTAMARNRWPLVIPCHRVVGADGKLTGYSGSGGLKTKRWLLDLEAGRASPNGMHFVDDSSAVLSAAFR